MGLQHLVNEVFINGSPNPFENNIYKNQNLWKQTTLQGT